MLGIRKSNSGRIYPDFDGIIEFIWTQTQQVRPLSLDFIDGQYPWENDQQLQRSTLRWVKKLLSGLKEQMS